MNSISLKSMLPEWNAHPEIRDAGSGYACFHWYVSHNRILLLLEWTCCKSWISQGTWILILMKAVCKACNITANSAWPEGGHVITSQKSSRGSRALQYTALAQASSADYKIMLKKIKLEAITVFSESHSVLNSSKIYISKIMNKCLEYSTLLQ